MAERSYTTKSRAKRIVLDYFKRPHPFRSARRWLSIALPALAAVIVVAYAVRGDFRLYNSGPVSTAHTMFGARCEHCHTQEPITAAGVTPKARTFFLPVSNQTCSVCHKGPIHHDKQSFEPPCTNCHFEHKGRGQLGAFGDRQCTQCHRGLTTKDGKPAFHEIVTGFETGHPEFKVTLVRQTPPAQGPTKLEAGGRVRLDDGSLRDLGETCLNHETHQKANLFPRNHPDGETWYRAKPGVIDPDKNPRLGCAYCHEADGERAYMVPVKYDKACKDCHAIEFGAPHKEPDKVRDFLKANPPKPVAAAAAAAEEPAAPTRGSRLFGRGGEQPAAKAPVEEDKPATTRSSRRFGHGDDQPAEEPKGFKTPEDVLFFSGADKTCLFCHALSVPGAPVTRASCGQSKNERRQAVEALRTALGTKLPEVVPTNMQARWFPHSEFTHFAHRPFTCTVCHDKAKTSSKTADVLMPKIASCRSCHTSTTGARTACVECHTYHHKKDGPLEGLLTLEAVGRSGRR